MYGGGLIIRNKVLKAAHKIIVPSNHAYEDALIPIIEHGLILKGIVMKDDVMKSHCDHFVLVFNGKIYNSLSLRHEIEQNFGPNQWRRHLDTETLLSDFR